MFTYFLTQRPPSFGTHPEENLTNYPGDDECQIASHGRRYCYRLEYSQRLTEDEVRRYELMPTTCLDKGAELEISFGRYTGLVIITEVSEDRTLISCYQKWDDQEGEPEEWSVMGFINEYNLDFELVTG